MAHPFAHVLGGTLLAASGFALGSTSASAQEENCSTLLESSGADSLSNRYEVRRNGSRIGSHRITFDQMGAALRVTSTTQMRVRLLFVTAFSYDYESVELWCNGRLERVDTRVREGRDRQETLARRVGPDAMEVRGSEGSETITGDFSTTNHWNSAAVEKDAWFNTITGGLNNVTVSKLSTDERDVSRYAVRGMLNIDTFYDRYGNWQGMIFDHTDGSEIRFDCVTCSATPRLVERSRAARRFAQSHTGGSE